MVLKRKIEAERVVDVYGGEAVVTRSVKKGGGQDM